VLEYAARLRQADRVRGFQTKAFLKQHALRYLPREIVHRKKRGLSVPLGSWLRGPLRAWARERLGNAGLELAGLSTDGVLAYFDEHASRRADHARSLSALLALAEWCTWVRDLRAAQARKDEEVVLIPFASPQEGHVPAQADRQPAAAKAPRRS
jgi:asparagine synthase (glutamine-hydrolysing)